MKGCTFSEFSRLSSSCKPLRVSTNALGSCTHCIWSLACRCGGADQANEKVTQWCSDAVCGFWLLLAASDCFSLLILMIADANLKVQMMQLGTFSEAYCEALWWRQKGLKFEFWWRTGPQLLYKLVQIGTNCTLWPPILKSGDTLLLLCGDQPSLVAGRQVLQGRGSETMQAACELLQEQGLLSGCTASLFRPAEMFEYHESNDTKGFTQLSWLGFTMLDELECRFCCRTKSLWKDLQTFAWLGLWLWGSDLVTSCWKVFEYLCCALVVPLHLCQLILCFVLYVVSSLMR